jgi:hypothetical protein
LARLRAQQSHASTVKEAAAELWLVAKEHQEEAARLNGGELFEIGNRRLGYERSKKLHAAAAALIDPHARRIGVNSERKARRPAAVRQEARVCGRRPGPRLPVAVDKR